MSGSGGSWGIQPRSVDVFPLSDVFDGEEFAKWLRFYQQLLVDRHSWHPPAVKAAADLEAAARLSEDGQPAAALEVARQHFPVMQAADYDLACDAAYSEETVAGWAETIYLECIVWEDDEEDDDVEILNLDGIIEEVGNTMFRRCGQWYHSDWGVYESYAAAPKHVQDAVQVAVTATIKLMKEEKC